MIYARFISPDGTVHDYADIWEISIDAERISGMYFYSQDARMGTFGVELDEFIQSAVVESSHRWGSSSPLYGTRYLPTLIEIRVDDSVIFTGFTKHGSRTRKVYGVTEVEIKLFDPLYVMLEVAEKAELEVWQGTSYNAQEEAIRHLKRMAGLCRDLFEPYNIRLAEEINIGANVQGYYVYGTMLEPEYQLPEVIGTITRRELTAYSEISGWYVEYVRTAEIREVQNIARGRRYQLIETLVWIKYKMLGDHAEILQNVRRTQTSVYDAYNEDYGIDYAAMEAAAEAYFATVARLTSLYPIHPGGFIVNFDDGTNYYKLDGYVVKRRVPLSEYFVIGEVEKVRYIDYLSGLMRVICGWVQTVGREIRVMPRLDYPGVIVREITDDEILGGMEISGAEIQGNDFGFEFLADSEGIKAIIDQVFQDFIRDAIPYAFNWDGVGIDYEVGSCYQYDGWTILLTSAEKDLAGNETRLSGVGKR